MMIIKAELRHAAEVAAIERECFHDPWPQDLIERWITGEDKRFLVCVDEHGTVLGYIGAQTVLDEGYIGNVAVTHAARRQGAGRALVEAMASEARRDGLAFLTLEVRAQNAAGRELYENCGFVEVGVRRGYYDKPPDDAVLMTLYL